MGPSKLEPGYTSSQNRLERLKEALVAMPEFQKNPKRFFFIETYWKLAGWTASPRAAPEMLTNNFFREVYAKASWGLQETGYGKDKAGCVITSPWVPKTKLPFKQETFEQWMKRSIALFWRYYARRTANGEHLRPPLLKADKTMPFKHVIVKANKHPHFLEEI